MTDTLTPTMWSALETHADSIDCGLFMYMGSGQGPKLETIQQYKHCYSRRYLHISEDGQTFYRYTGLGGAAAFEVITKQAALAKVND